MKYLLDGEESSRLYFRTVNESHFLAWLEFFKDPVSHSNIPSQKVAEKNGMKITRSTIYADNDVFIYRITKLEWVKRMSVYVRS